MLESFMENLIAKYPSEFFPRKTLTLTGRQGSFSGVGRFDLLFQDEHQTTILMELKARPAKYEDASQLAKYYDVFKQQGKSNILMWLVATAVPQSVREFLDRIGIEYTEIHESEYRIIALRHGEITEEVNSPAPVMPNTVSLEKSESTFHSNRLTRNSNYYKSKISPKYRVSLERFSNIFPTACEFLKTVA
ncbi:MAG TPA: endonuclease NucS, partial [Ignavibacteria bacterium]|nr:endonuclease NucS [Ignavibacteria bacterium]